MSRISKRSAADAADELLEAGRTQRALDYDVDVGLARHHEWLRSNAPVPAWASPSAGASVWGPVAIKTAVATLVAGAIGTAAWHARDRPEPAADAVQASSPAAEPKRNASPNAPDVGDGSQTSRAAAPHLDSPSEPGPPEAKPARRAVREDAPERRTSHARREPKAPASSRAASPPGFRRVDAANGPAPRSEHGATATKERSENVGAGRATDREAAPAPEREPLPEAPSARPEVRPQAPDDLAEMQQVATAERLLERSPKRALALVRQGDQRFANGYFRQERAFIAIMALIRLGRVDEARARAARFAEQFPALPYGARIRTALEEAQQASAR